MLQSDEARGPSASAVGCKSVQVLRTANMEAAVARPFLMRIEEARSLVEAFLRSSTQTTCRRSAAGGGAQPAVHGRCIWDSRLLNEPRAEVRHGCLLKTWVARLALHSVPLVGAGMVQRDYCEEHADGLH